MTEEKEVSETKKEDKRHRCKKCGSVFGYVRLKDKTYICRACGYEDKELVI